jgi:hypothetical protein
VPSVNVYISDELKAAMQSTPLPWSQLAAQAFRAAIHPTAAGTEMNGDDDDEFRLFPAWRHALQVLLDQGLPYGRAIEKKELVQLFELKDPVTARDQRQFDIEFMSMLSCVRAELLESHQLDLHTLWGRSQYVVTAPSEQTDLAMIEGIAEMQRALTKATRRLTHIRLHELTDEQARQNADALAQTAALAGMVNRPRLTHGKGE